MERLAVPIGALGVALLAVDGVLANQNHHGSKGYLLAWGIGLAVFAAGLGIAGLLGQHFKEKEAATPAPATGQSAPTRPVFIRKPELQTAIVRDDPSDLSVGGFRVGVTFVNGYSEAVVFVVESVRVEINGRSHEENVSSFVPRTVISGAEHAINLGESERVDISGPLARGRLDYSIVFKEMGAFDRFRLRESIAFSRARNPDGSFGGGELSVLSSTTDSVIEP